MESWKLAVKQSYCSGNDVLDTHIVAMEFNTIDHAL